MNFKLKSVYNFTTYSPAITGGGFKRVKVVAIADYNTAKQYSNVDLLQRQIYSKLPQGTIDRPSTYTYVIIEDNSGKRTAVAYQWIIEASIIEVQNTDLNIRVRNVDDSDIIKLNSILTSMGYSYEITTIEA